MISRRLIWKLLRMVLQYLHTVYLPCFILLTLNNVPQGAVEGWPSHKLEVVVVADLVEEAVEVHTMAVGATEAHTPTTIAVVEAAEAHMMVGAVEVHTVVEVVEAHTVVDVRTLTLLLAMVVAVVEVEDRFLLAVVAATAYACPSALIGVGSKTSMLPTYSMFVKIKHVY
jgi:hypothetical protein